MGWKIKKINALLRRPLLGRLGPYPYVWATRSFSSKFRVLFFGSDNLALQTLQALHESKREGLVSHLETVAPSDKPKGRGLKVEPGPVQRFSFDHSIPLHEVRKDVPFRMDGWELPNSAFDLGVVASFGYFLPQRILNQFPLGLINVHPSLLPKYRGAAPIQHTLLQGEKKTGCSIIRVHPSALDRGAVLSQRTIDIPYDATYASLYAQLATIGAQQVVEVLRNWTSLRELSQEGQEGTSAPAIQKQMGLVQWSNSSADEVYRQWQALYGYLPVYCMFKGKRVILKELVWLKHSDALPEPARPGTVVFVRSSLAVRCRSGWVWVTRLLLENKNSPMDAYGFASSFIHKMERGQGVAALSNPDVYFE